MTQLPSMTLEQQIAYLNWQGQNSAAQLNAQNTSNMRSSQQQNQMAWLQWLQQQALSQEYQNKLFESNQKNESRYNDILEGRYQTRDRLTGEISKYGQSMKDDANERYQQQAGAGIADAYARGFGGSPSVLQAAQDKANRSRDLELNRIDDQILDRRVGVDAQQSEGIYGFQERRNDVPPDLNQLIALQQGLGQAGFGGQFQPGFGGSRPNTGGTYNPSFGPSVTVGGIATADRMRRIGGGASNTPGGMERGGPGWLGPTNQNPQNRTGGNPFTPRGLYNRAGTQSAVPYIPLQMPQKTPQYGPTHGVTAPNQYRAPLPMDYRHMGSGIGLAPQYSQIGNSYQPTVMPFQQTLTAVKGVAPQATAQGYGGGQGGYPAPYPYMPYPQPYPQHGYQQDYGQQQYPPTPVRGYGAPPVRYTPQRGYIGRGIGQPMISAPASHIQYV